MKRLSLGLAVLTLLGALQARAEYREVDLKVFGMD